MIGRDMRAFLRVVVIAAAIGCTEPQETPALAARYALEAYGENALPASFGSYTKLPLASDPSTFTCDVQVTARQIRLGPGSDAQRASAWQWVCSDPLQNHTYSDTATGTFAQSGNEVTFSWTYTFVSPPYSLFLPSAEHGQVNGDSLTIDASEKGPYGSLLRFRAVP